MKITAIKQQVKSPNRFSVFIDESFEFGIDQLTLLDYNLKVGAELSQSQIEVLKQSAEVGKWYIKCLDKLYTRPHSVKEIMQYLQRKDQKDIAEKIINRLIQNKKLDDNNFALWFAESRRRSKHRSTQMIRSELLARGVSREVIETILPDLREGEPNALEELIRKKQKISRYKDEKKLMQYLARQGFRYGDIKQALLQLEQLDS